MQKPLIILLAAIIIFLIIGFIFFFSKNNGEIIKNIKTSETKNIMKITSPAFAEGGIIPQKYTCAGKNINPPLMIENAPENAKSLVLIVDDPDAIGGTFTHWILLNINSNTKEIKENSIAEEAVLGRNDFGEAKYGGPCPPSGFHRYFFKVYALDANLVFSGAPNRSQADKMMENHILGQGQLMAKFSK
jgi:Raf kinase inhibitor-like YbhB/YbcL family protein